MIFGRDVKINVTKIVNIRFFLPMQKNKPKVLIGASRFTGCIAVSVLDENVTGTAINVAVDRGVRVITFDSDAPNSKPWAYVGVNNFDYGVKLGDQSWVGPQ